MACYTKQAIGHDSPGWQPFSRAIWARAAGAASQDRLPRPPSREVCATWTLGAAAVVLWCAVAGRLEGSRQPEDGGSCDQDPIRRRKGL
jgi:hypothetical protein